MTPLRYLPRPVEVEAVRWPGNEGWTDGTSALVTAWLVAQPLTDEAADGEDQRRYLGCEITGTRKLPILHTKDTDEAEEDGFNDENGGSGDITIAYDSRIVRYPSGRVEVLTAAEFAERYEPAAGQDNDCDGSAP